MIIIALLIELFWIFVALLLLYGILLLIFYIISRDWFLEVFITIIFAAVILSFILL